MEENSNAKKTDEPRNAWHRVIRSDSFIEKAVLLVLTALLSGLLIPFIAKEIDRDRESREAITKAKGKLFDDISESILTIETLVLDVSWFGTQRAKNPEMQKLAFQRYTERSVDIIARWRVQTSRSHALASQDVVEKLNEFQTLFFKEQDTPMNELWIKCSIECDWQSQHSKNERMLAQANALIVDLAKDFGLTIK